MATPPFIELTDAETLFKAGVGQDLLRKVKDDFTNLNARTLQLEKFLKVHEDFIEACDPSGDPDGLGISFMNAAQVAAYSSLIDVWAISETTLYIGYDNTDSRSSHFNASKPAYSVARMSIPAFASSKYAQAYSRLALQFDQVTRPITFEARMKLSADGALFAGLRVGVRSGGSGQAISFDRNGIWLERVDATNWRFACYNGTRTSGTSFAKPTAGNWFKVKIEFTDTPSNRALCYVDDVLKETITTNLPTATPLRAWWQGSNFVSGLGAWDFDCDRYAFSALGLADAA